MSRAARRARSAVRDHRAGAVARAGAVQLAAFRAASIRARSCIASRLDLPTLRRSEDSFVDELALGVVARGYPLMRAHFPRCFVDVNREPYELDPRMFDGRLPSFANTRSMRVAGGLGTVARVVGDAQEIYDQRHLGRRRAPPHRESLQALSPRAAPAVHPRAPRVRRRHADRLPFDAVVHRAEGRAAARRRGAGRPLRHELRRARCRRRSRRRCASSATRSAATSPTPAASSPSTTATRPRACMPSSSRSTARSTWTSAASSARPASAALAADLETLADRLAAIPLEELRPYRAAAE